MPEPAVANATDRMLVVQLPRAVEGARYRVQLARDAAFSELAFDEVIERYRARGPPPLSGPLLPAGAGDRERRLRGRLQRAAADRRGAGALVAVRRHSASLPAAGLVSLGGRRAAWHGLAAGLAGAVALAASALPLTTGLDLRLLDLALRWLPLTAPAPPVVLVAIDEPSLEAFGPWPWSRRRLADLLDRLGSVAPAAVAIDLLLAEPAAADPDADAALAASMARLGKVVLAVAGTYHDRNTPALEVLPEPSLAEAAAALGHTNAAADPDGHLRRLHRKAGVGTAYWPTLAGAALAVARGEPHRYGATRKGTAAGLPEARPPPLAPALSRVQRVSFHALAEAGPRDLPQGAVLVIGVTAAGLGPVPGPRGRRGRTLRGAEVQVAATMALGPVPPSPRSMPSPAPCWPRWRPVDALPWPPSPPAACSC